MSASVAQYVINTTVYCHHPCYATTMIASASIYLFGLKLVRLKDEGSSGIYAGQDYAVLLGFFTMSSFVTAFATSFFDSTSVKVT